MKKILTLLAVLLIASCTMTTEAKKKRSGKRTRTTTNYNSPANIEKQKQALQGTYLAFVEQLPSMSANDVREMQRQYGKYIIDGDIIKEYSWDDGKKDWKLESESTYKLKYIPNKYYMTGYNILFSGSALCSGDCNSDGKLDLWMSDSIFRTKQ